MFRSIWAATAISCMGLPAAADISADDVWRNYQAQMQALGVTLTGQFARAGGTVTVSEQQMRATFPFAFGSISTTLPPMTLTEQGDGTVAITYPDRFVVAMNVNIPVVGIGTGALEITHTGLRSMARGAPGDITYETSADGMALAVTEIDIAGEDLTLTARFLSEGYSSKTRITEGALITTHTEISNAPIRGDYSAGQGEDLVTTGSFRYGTSTSTTTLALPAGGSDVLNLTPALKAGLSLVAESITDGSESASVTFRGDREINAQTNVVGAGTSRLRIDESGLSLFAQAVDILTELRDPSLMPGEIAFEAGSATGGYSFPLVASDDPQSASLELRASNVRMGPRLWALIDPEKALNRTPAGIAISLSSQLDWGVDLLDFLNLESVFESDELPISLRNIDIGEIALAALGATVQADGGFGFDNTDLDTYDGFPKPVGDVTATIKGANALMDQLVGAGIVSDGDLSMVRLGLGMFTRVVDDDTVTATVELTEEGRIYANGERVR